MQGPPAFAKEVGSLTPAQPRASSAALRERGRPQAAPACKPATPPGRISMASRLGLVGCTGACCAASNERSMAAMAPSCPSASSSSSAARRAAAAAAAARRFSCSGASKDQPQVRLRYEAPPSLLLLMPSNPRAPAWQIPSFPHATSTHSATKARSAHSQPATPTRPPAPPQLHVLPACWPCQPTRPGTHLLCPLVGDVLGAQQPGELGGGAAQPRALHAALALLVLHSTGPH